MPLLETPFFANVPQIDDVRGARASLCAAARAAAGLTRARRLRAATRSSS
jgi:hypothetical protein